MRTTPVLAAVLSFAIAPQKALWGFRTTKRTMRVVANEVKYDEDDEDDDEDDDGDDEEDAEGSCK